MKKAFTFFKSNSRFLSIFIFLTSISTLFGQVVYTDITPDAELINKDSIYLDINNDGQNDFILFHRTYSDPNNYNYLFAIYSNDNTAVALTKDSASAIFYEESIDESLDWSISNETYIHQLKLGYDYDSIGNWTNVREAFLGLKLIINNQNHYAWLRINYSEELVMWAVDYAYNETPQEPIFAGQELPSFTTSVHATDEHDHFDGRDIVVSFTKAFDELLFSEYRIIIAKANDTTALDVSVMSQLPAERYYSMMVNPADISFTKTRSLRETTVDKDGDSIEKFTDYKAYILNVAQSGNIDDNMLSQASNLINLQAYALATNTPHAYDRGDDNSATDIEVSFRCPKEQDFLSEFRVFIVDIEDLADFNAPEAWLLSNEYYTSYPTGDSTVSIHLLNQKDSSGDDIEDNKAYQVFVLSVADSINSITSALSHPSDRVVLHNPNFLRAGQVDGDHINVFECDYVFSDMPYWTGNRATQVFGEADIDINRDGLSDFHTYGYVSYGNSGASVMMRITPNRNNKVLICDHPEHENWVKMLNGDDAIGDHYNWYEDEAIVVDYSNRWYSDHYHYWGHLESTTYDFEYMIGLCIMDSGTPQYAWLKMHGRKFYQYGFEDVKSSTNNSLKITNIRFFPNPAHHQIQISTNESTKTPKPFSITVLNSLGKVIDQFDIINGSIMKDIRSYSPGLYVFLVKNEDQIIENHKIIIE